MPKTLAAVLLILVAACAPTRSAAPPLSEEESAEVVVLRVENLAFNDATLHAISPGGRIRLGRVRGRGQETFRIRWSVPRDLRVEIDLLAGGRYTTPGVPVSPGERLELIIEEPLSRSFIRR
jgi:hypothetical protein